MSNETKKPTGWDADEVLCEMREWDRLEEWPSDLITLTRWADVLADLIAERERVMSGSRALWAHATLPRVRTALAALQRELAAPIHESVLAEASHAISWSKILADGTRASGNDPRDDHVAIIDHTTGLMWSVESLGDENHPDVGAAYGACAAGCAALRLLGHSDWRLPTRKELAALVDDTRREPAIDTSLFPRVKPCWHWASTPWIDRNGNASASDAWGVYFGFGYVSGYRRSYDGFALAVRRPGQ